MSNLRNGSKGGFEPGLTRLRVWHSTTELPRSTWNELVKTISDVIIVVPFTNTTSKRLHQLVSLHTMYIQRYQLIPLSNIIHFGELIQWLLLR